MIPNEETSSRPPLTKERVLQAAMDLADQDGLGALTMRRLGAELGVEAMSLYKHVANKDEILEGIIERVVGKIEIPSSEAGWKEAMRQRAISAREVLGRHSWAIGLFEARGSRGPSVQRYLNAILGSLRAGGFSVENAGYAFSLLDSYVYGHVIQESSMPFGTPDDATESTESLVERVTAEEYPHLAEIGEHALTSGFTFDNAFEYGLGLILDALETATSPGV